MVKGLEGSPRELLGGGDHYTEAGRINRICPARRGGRKCYMAACQFSPLGLCSASCHMEGPVPSVPGPHLLTFLPFQQTAHAKQLKSPWSQHPCSGNRPFVGQFSSSITLSCPVPKVSGASAIQPEAIRSTLIFEQRWVSFLLQQGRRHTMGDRGPLTERVYT